VRLSAPEARDVRLLREASHVNRAGSFVGIIGLVTASLARSCGDRFWSLRIAAVTPQPLDTTCVRRAMGTVEGVDSTSFRMVTRPRPYLVERREDTLPPWGEYRIFGDAWGSLNQTFDGDSTRLEGGYGWVGPKPKPQDVAEREAFYQNTLEVVRRVCGTGVSADRYLVRTRRNWR
jgi:hypothetical protein